MKGESKHILAEGAGEPPEAKIERETCFGPYVWGFCAPLFSEEQLAGEDFLCSFSKN